MVLPSPVDVGHTFIPNPNPSLTDGTVPLQRNSSRDFNPLIEIAVSVSGKSRGSDSQPGILSKAFGPTMFLCGGTIDASLSAFEEEIVGKRGGAVLLGCREGLAWITHARVLKVKADGRQGTNPKVPIVGVWRAPEKMYGVREIELRDWRRG
ncbi:hypothetical protein BT69DRAFT_1300417 [Atractiella rhizophila]|nr:hypothetical protein BT69DRAFT_1300417 [Atractiella rhizophila]